MPGIKRLVREQDLRGTKQYEFCTAVPIAKQHALRVVHKEFTASAPPSFSQQVRLLSLLVAA